MLGTFNISGFIKTAQTGTSNGACLNVYWYDTNKNFISVNVMFNVRNTNWQQYKAILQSPSGATYAKVMAITYGSYDGYFDNIQFEKSQLFRGYNFIENSSFEKGNVEWSASDGNSTIISYPNSYSGSYDAKISLSSVGTSYVQSSTTIPALPGQYYTLLGFIKTNGISNGVGGGGAWIHVYFYDINNTYINDYTTQAIGGTTGWTKYVFPFGPPANSATMKVMVEVANSLGTAYFDNIRLSYGKQAVTSKYDSNKNYVISAEDQTPSTITMQPDAYGQNLKLTSPGGEVTQYTYDGQERLRTVTDNAGNTTTYNLDANGNILDSSLANTYNKMTFAYDRNNNITSMTDANNNKTQFSYDEEGRITNKTNPNSTNVSSNYDNYGNLNQVSLSNGPTYNYNYDLEGHTTNSSVINETSMQYSYDPVGNLISQVEKDSGGNIITTIGAPSSGSMYSNIDQILGYNFTYKGYTSNPIAYSYSYSKAGLLNSYTQDGKTFSFNYDESNNPISKTNPNNLTDKLAYNDASKVTSIQTIDNNSNVKWSSNYSFNSDGKVTQITGTGPGNPSASYTYNNGTEKLNRLTSATINDGVNQNTFNYTYDPAGNILTMDTANGTGTPNHLTFNYDADNRIINSGFSYDGSAGASNGNLTSAVINGVSYQYVYDANNRLITVKDGAGSTLATYTYDAEGNRITKTVGNVTTTYHYFMGSLQYETLSTDPANVIHALYLRTAQGALEGVSLNYVIGSTSNTYYYYHYNAHGDVTVVTDSNGNVFRQYTYDPYGNIISAKDGSGNTININIDAGFNNAYLYAGYRYDSESGLYFLNARYYASGIGRFLTKDSIISKATPKTQNLYAYVGGDPVNAYDPTGLAMEENLDEGGVGYYSSTAATNYSSDIGESLSQSKAVSTGVSALETGISYGISKIPEWKASVTTVFKHLNLETSTKRTWLAPAKTTYKVGPLNAILFMLNIRHDVTHNSGKKLTEAILIDASVFAIGVAAAVFLPETAVAAGVGFGIGLIVGGAASIGKKKLGIS